MELYQEVSMFDGSTTVIKKESDEAKEFDPVNRPEHYANTKVECIDAMERIFGREAVINFTILNLWKYLWCRGDKGNEEQDIQKALWYFDKAKELINK